MKGAAAENVDRQSQEVKQNILSVVLYSLLFEVCNFYNHVTKIWDMFEYTDMCNFLSINIMDLVIYPLNSVYITLMKWCGFNFRIHFRRLRSRGGTGKKRKLSF